MGRGGKGVRREVEEVRVVEWRVGRGVSIVTPPYLLPLRCHRA